MRYCIIITLCLVPTSIFAQSQEKKNILENLASLVVAQEWCDDYIIKKESIIGIALAAKIDPDNKAEKKFLDDKKEEFANMMGKSGANAYCAFAYKVFGPGGNIPGLMMKK